MRPTSNSRRGAFASPAPTARWACSTWRPPPRAGVPIVLDETVFSPDDCRRAIDLRLGQGVNIKIAKSGIAGSADILRLARRAGLRLMIGCMTETMVGLSAGLCLAGGTGAFDYVDLDSVHFLHHRARRGDGIAVDGKMYAFVSS
jgi:L-alanine-DL-glutamate epimerase-like enolase superfamily enzyme